MKVYDKEKNEINYKALLEEMKETLRRMPIPAVVERLRKASDVVNEV